MRSIEEPILSGAGSADNHSHAGNCPLFDFVAERERERCGGAPQAWLDAGTGEHSLDYLVHCVRPARLVAVTGDEQRAHSLRRAYERHLPPHSRILSDNWQNAELLANETFDVVLAGAFVA